MPRDEAQSEALRKKSLGELGELISIKALVDVSFEKIVNLNDKKMNYPYADLYAEKEGQRYVISVKARNKYQKDKRLNAFYNIGSNAYRKAAVAEKEYSAKAYWLAVQFDKLTYSVYLGSLEELNFKNQIPIRKCEDSSVGVCLVKDKRHFFDFDYFGNS